MILTTDILEFTAKLTRMLNDIPHSAWPDHISLDIKVLYDGEPTYQISDELGEWALEDLDDA